MRKATLNRTESDDQGTFGTWTSDSGFQCYIGEPPWRDNHPNLSCIPPGVYQVQMSISPRHGMCYHVQDVPGRSDVLIHKGNFCGDTIKGYKSDTEACLLPGRAIDQIAGQKAVISSSDALQALQADLDGEAFELTIIATGGL